MYSSVVVGTLIPLSNISTIHLKEFLIISNGNAVPIQTIAHHFLMPTPMATTIVLSGFMNLTILATLHKRNHIIFVPVNTKILKPGYDSFRKINNARS